MWPREDINGAGVASQQEMGKGMKMDNDLSEEDQALKEKLKLYVVSVQDSDRGIQKLLSRVFTGGLLAGKKALDSAMSDFQYLDVDAP